MQLASGLLFMHRATFRFTNCYHLLKNLFNSQSCHKNEIYSFMIILLQIRLQNLDITETIYTVIQYKNTSKTLPS